MLGFGSKNKKHAGRSTVMHLVEKQVNLQKGDENARIKWMFRIAWSFAHKINDFDAEKLQQLIEQNAEGQAVDLMMDEALFYGGMKFTFIYAVGWFQPGVEAISWRDWAELSDHKKKSYSNPVIRIAAEDDEPTIIQHEDDETGAMADRFVEAFWAMADKFTGYRQNPGKAEFTLQFAGVKNNFFPVTKFGYNEKGVSLTLGLDLSAQKLGELSNKDVRKFLTVSHKALTEALANVQGAMRNLNNPNPGSNDNPKDEDGSKTILDYLTEIAHSWENESSRKEFDSRVQKLRDDELTDDEIIESFEVANWYVKAISQARDKAKKATQKDGGKGSKQPEPKQPKQKNPAPKGDYSEYESEAFHRTMDEWKSYILDPKFDNAIKQGIFDELSADGKVAKPSVFTLADCYEEAFGVVPAFLDKERHAEVDRIKAKRSKGDE